MRMKRIFDQSTKKTVIIPMDHGVTVGPIDGLLDLSKMVNDVSEGGANAVLGHMGLPLYGYKNIEKNIGLILHLSASTIVNPTDPNDKVLVNTVERAIKMGADAVSLHINIGSKTESEQLEILGMIAGDCMEWGMPLLAMMYPRGEGLTDGETSPAMVKLAARIGAELGADIIKTYYTGDPDTMKEVVEGCPVPVVIAGGSKLGDEETLKMIKGAMDAGCAGISIGRNVFQHKTPAKFVKASSSIVHKNASIKDALKILNS